MFFFATPAKTTLLLVESGLLNIWIYFEFAFKFQRSSCLCKPEQSGACHFLPEAPHHVSGTAAGQHEKYLLPDPPTAGRAVPQRVACRVPDEKHCYGEDGGRQRQHRTALRHRGERLR